MTCKANYATRVNRIMPAGLIGFHTNWSDSGRIHFEAAFAALAGICPLSPSSGNTSWRRLNRGGVRRLNRAIHTIVRMNFYSRTKAYVQSALRRATARRRQSAA